MENNFRSWGRFWILEDAINHKLLRLHINPETILTFNVHKNRIKTLTILSGLGRITLNDISKDYNSGEVVSIFEGVEHCIENQLKIPLIIFELQYNSYSVNKNYNKIDDQHFV